MTRKPYHVLQSRHGSKATEGMKISFLFAWYDLWVGAYWDAGRRRLYVLPVPMFGVVIQFNGTEATEES